MVPIVNQGCAGGTIMSATPRRSVALGFSGVNKGKDLTDADWD
jgi:hypothetical protein